MAFKFHKGEFTPTPFTQGYWRLNGNSQDLSGHGNNGTDTAVSYSPSNGRFGSGGSFNGSTSYISMGNVLDNDGTKPLTLSVWFKTTAGGAIPYAIIGKQMLTSPYAGYELGMNDVTGALADAGKISFSWNDNLSVSIWKETNAAFNDGKWHCAVATYDGSKNITGINIYIDGVLQATTNSGTSFTGSASNTYNFMVGVRPDPLGQYFPGYLDEGIYESRAWSISEVAQYYAKASKYYTPIRRSSLTLPAIIATFTEAISNTDTLLRNIWTKFSEAITNTDIFSSLLLIYKQLIEAITNTDTILRNVWVKFTEAITNTDTLLRKIFLKFVESITNTDVYSSIASLSIRLTESIKNYDRLFLNGLLSIWTKRVKGNVSWIKRTVGNVIWNKRLKP